MARKADLFHLTPGYVTMGAGFHIKGSHLPGKASSRQSHPERGRQGRNLLELAFLQRHHAGEKERTGCCFQGDKELVPRGPAVPH